MPDNQGPKQALSVMEDLRRFMGSRVLLSAAELDLFSRLDKEPSSAPELALELGVDRKGVTRVLDCLVVMGYLSKDGERYEPSPAGRLLSSHQAGNVLPMALHLNEVWKGWSNLSQTVRLGENPEIQPLTSKDEESCRAFIGAMDVVGASLAEEIAATFPLTGRRCLLDVGGGCGSYTAAFLRKNPGLQAVLFDLPQVVPLAEAKMEQAGLDERVRIVAGDFSRDDLPRGCDVALLSAIIHQNSPEENAALFGKIGQALDPGGMLIIRDHIMSESRTEPPAGAMFAINMLVNTPGGDTYTFSEVAQGLSRTGFEEIRLARSGERMDCLVTARRP